MCSSDLLDPNHPHRHEAHETEDAQHNRHGAPSHQPFALNPGPPWIRLVWNLHALELKIVATVTPKSTWRIVQATLGTLHARHILGQPNGFVVQRPGEARSVCNDWLGSFSLEHLASCCGIEAGAP